jgi:multiple sugar transport system permease protein
MPRVFPRGFARRREALAAYAYLGPAFAGFVVFVLGPAVAAVALTFFEYDILTPPRFAGLANYARFLGDPRLPRIYLNTVVYVGWYVGLTTLLGLALAVAAHRPMRALWRYLIRSAYFFPVLTSLASVSLVWQYLYSTDFGIINYYLARLGIPRIPWLTSSQWAIASIILLGVWKNLGFNFILFLAGLQNIPRHLYEAAAIDGAGGWRSFWSITLPLLRPVFLFVLVTHVIGSFQIFGQVFVLTNGGPGDATRTVVQHLYETAFQNFFHFGSASAMAWVLFLVILAFSLLQFRLLRGHTQY